MRKTLYWMTFACCCIGLSDCGSKHCMFADLPVPGCPSGYDAVAGGYYPSPAQSFAFYDSILIINDDSTLQANGLPKGVPSLPKIDFATVSIIGAYVVSSSRALDVKSQGYLCQNVTTGARTYKVEYSLKGYCEDSPTSYYPGFTALFVTQKIPPGSKIDLELINVNQ